MGLIPLFTRCLTRCYNLAETKERDDNVKSLALYFAL